MFDRGHKIGEWTADNPDLVTDVKILDMLRQATVLIAAVHQSGHDPRRHDGRSVRSEPDKMRRARHGFGLCQRHARATLAQENITAEDRPQSLSHAPSPATFHNMAWHEDVKSQSLEMAEGYVVLVRLAQQ